MMAEDLELVEEAVPERRRAPRPEPPPPPPVRRFVDWLADLVESGWQGWLALGLVCSACIGFLYWNLTVRFERFDETYLLIREQVALQNRFDVLAAHYSREELHELLERISSAESSIFADYASLAAWLAGQSTAAGEHDLQLTYRMHEPISAQIRNVTEVPITITVRPLEDQGAGTYQRLLRFLREMVAARWHLEIVDASVHGDGKAVASLDTTVRVWVNSREPVVAGEQES